MKEERSESKKSTNGASNGSAAKRRASQSQELREIAELLFEVYKLERFADAEYLRWQYRDNPYGPAVESEVREGGRVLAHMAGVPQRMQRGAVQMPAVVLVNIGVSEAARGRGLMNKISFATFEGTQQRYGDAILIGIPNAGSTPAYSTKYGFRLFGQLPVIVLPPVWPSLEKVESRAVDEVFLQSRAFSELFQSLDLSPGPDRWTHVYTADVLAWRLRTPGMRYAIHTSADHVLITTATRQSGVPVCVVVKTFARRGARKKLANAVAAAACRHHRAAAAVYAGFSDKTRLIGVPMPERLKPAPLNLIVRGTRPESFELAGFEYGACEFFDFDAF